MHFLVGSFQMPSTDPPSVLTIHDMVRANRGLSQAAIVDDSGGEMGYGQFYELIVRTVGTLNSAGYRRGDRIALSLPDGALAGAAIASLTSGFTVIPINPGQTPSEYGRYLPDLKARAIVTLGGCSSAARDVAAGMGLERIDLVRGGGAGEFSIAGLERGNAEPDLAKPEDIANVMLTSGTTAKPKRVPWTHSNVVWGLYLGLGPEAPIFMGRNLILAPLFHGAGISAFYRCIYTGATAICPNGFKPEGFFGLLDRTRPSSFFATPAIYKVIVERAAENRDIISRTRLKVISTASASMPVGTLKDLQTVFGARISEAYALTEAGLVGRRPRDAPKDKMGVVMPLVDVRIIDGSGKQVPAGEMGEIAIKGPNVFGGYEDDPEENARAFVDGWFRSGDLGYIGGDGYIRLCGRVKEMINRGGEKVAPREVDEALMEHPAVLEAAAFPVQHPKLGEDVGVAVVLRDGMAVTDAELRTFVSQRLAFFKVPARIVFVKEIPKGAMGKVARGELATRLGVTSALRERPEYVEPRTEEERKLVAILQRIMGHERVGVKDSFFDLGGYSLMAVRLFADIEKELGVALPLSTLFQHPTVEGLASLLGSKGGKKTWPTLVPLQTNGSGPSLFLIHGGDGDILNYKDLVRALGEGRKIYGIQAKGLDGREEPESSIHRMAEDYVRRVMEVEPEGPYYLAGFSAGGVTAFEMARQLEAMGKRVAFTGIIDMDLPERTPDRMRRNSRRTFSREVFYLARDLMPNSRRRRAGVDLRVMHRVRGIFRLGLASVSAQDIESPDLLLADEKVLPASRRRVWTAHMKAVNSYQAGLFRGRVTVFNGERLPFIYPDAKECGWDRYAGGGVDFQVVPGKIHGQQLRMPNVLYLAHRMKESMARAAGSP